LVTGEAIAVDALPAVGIDAVAVIDAAHTRWARGTIDAVRLVAATAAIIGGIADHTLLIDALLTVTVSIAHALDAAGAIRQADRVAITPGVV
tara:strand:- start:201 stop:476 length:276 start_codon:yes stop_codon:yes gene_type:complete